MSPLIKPDLSQAIEFKPLDGTYPTKIKTVDFQNSQAGNPMIVPTMELDVDGRTVTRKAFLVISGEGSGQFGQLLRACHFDDMADKYADKSIPSSEKPEFNTDDLVGQELNTVWQPRLRDGEMRDNCKAFLRK